MGMVDRALMDYVVVPRNVIQGSLVVMVMRGEGSGISDHFLVEGRLRVGSQRVVPRKAGE